MSWKDAVQGVAKEMLDEAEDLAYNQDAGSVYCRSTLKGYARTLKAICESAGDQSPPVQFPIMAPGVGGNFGFPMISPDLQHHLEVEKVKASGEFKKAKSNVDIEERHGGDGTFAIGGPADGTYVVIDPNMPIGARSVFAGGVYKLVQVKEEGKDPLRRLEYDEQETLRIQTQRSGN